MKVIIKDLSVDMEVKANGIEFEVRTPDDATQLGDLYLTMSGLTWCTGKTSKAKGLKVGWQDFIDIMKSPETLKAAVKAAKKA